MEYMIPLRVMVGNGSVLDCRQVCSATNLLIQGHSFTVTLRVLPLSGADIVLGVEWLRTLGPIIIDYTSFTMHFTHLGQPVTLHADVQFNTDPISAHQVKRMIHTHSTSGLFHLSLLLVNKPKPPVDPPHPISAINELLLQFSSLFQQPSILPHLANMIIISTSFPQLTSLTSGLIDILIFKKLKSKNRLQHCLIPALSNQAEALFQCVLTIGQLTPLQ